MAKLVRWNPFQEMLRMRDTMDRFFEEPWFESAPAFSGWMTVPLDVSETDEAFRVKVSIPGVNPDDLEITYRDHLLTIKGEIQEVTEEEEGRYHMRERRYGAFSRTVSLPSAIDDSRIEATYEAGVLTLRLPKSEEAKPKRITVRSRNGKKVIEG